MEKAKGSNLISEDILTDVTGVYPKVMIDGDVDVGACSCGMGVGLIHDSPTCKGRIDGIMAEAEILIRACLEGILFDVKSATT